MSEKDSSEEFEVVALSPIRKLEKRIEEIEKSTPEKEIDRLIEQVIELVKANQNIVDDLVKTNVDLRNEISKIPSKIDELLSVMHEFMALIKTASEEEIGGVTTENIKPLNESLNRLIEISQRSIDANQSMMSLLDTIDKRLKRFYVVPRKPEGPSFTSRSGIPQIRR